MSQQLALLESILKRNSADPDQVDIANEVDHYFFFDAIADPDDLEAAWAVFDEQTEIRRRLAVIEAAAQIMPGWGYRTVRQVQSPPVEDELKKLVATHIASLRPLIDEDESNADIVAFIDRGFTVELAPASQAAPHENALDIVLDEALTDYQIDHFPFSAPHYAVLYNWATYLTKCNEVAAYLLWPCLRHARPVAADTADAGARLWMLGWSNSYWIKEGNPALRTLCVRAPVAH